MEIKNSHRNYTKHVEKYIGSAFDTVKLVADNIKAVLLNANWLMGTDYVPLYNVDSYYSGTDFTGGVTTSLLLSEITTVKEDIDIHFDGVYQHKHTYDLEGTNEVIFNSPIPVATVYVEIKFRYINTVD